MAKIRELRNANGLTQEQLASALRVTSHAVSKWEMSSGYPDVSILPVLAGYFGVTLDSFFDYAPDVIEEKIMEILYSSRVDAKNFEECEKILLDGIEKYPSGHILKRELEMVCESEAAKFFDLGDYENALCSFEENANLLEFFRRRPILKEYALL